MEALAIVAVLVLLAKGAQAASSSSTPAPTPTPAPAPADAGGGGGGGAAGLIGAGVTLAGLAVKVVTGITGGAGTAAGTGAAAAGAGAAAGVAAGGLVGAVTVTLLMNPIAWVIYVLIGTIVSRHNEIAKNFLDACRNMAPNARAMHEYERWLWEDFTQNHSLGGVSKSEVRDGRLDKRWREGNGSVTLQGWRTVVSVLPPPRPRDGSAPDPLHTTEGIRTIFRRMRAAALVYLTERGRYGYAILMNKPGFPQPSSNAGWSLDDFNMNQKHDAAHPGVGGLMQVPLLDGRVEAGYRAEPENPWPPVEQLRAEDATPDFDGIAESDVQAARLAALIDAIGLFRHDQTIDLREPGPWADDLYKWLGQPSGLERSGRTWITDPAIYGHRYFLDVWAAKTGTGKVVSAS